MKNESYRKSTEKYSVEHNHTLGSSIAAAHISNEADPWQLLISYGDLFSTSFGEGVKRGLDIVLSAGALILLSPLLLIIAIAIKATSKGPIIFKQQRHGLNGKLFTIFKFRTMYSNLCDATGVQQTVSSDPRITSIGSFLRRSNFDELPQLINVLLGNMSLVGPRPHIPGMLAAGVPYETFDPRYSLRHSVKPGITGWAQVAGYRGETSDPHAARMRLECDLAYVGRRSNLLDIKIMFRTLCQEVVSSSGS